MRCSARLLVLCTVAFAAVLAGADVAAAQAVPRVGDRVRAETTAGTVTGEVLAVDRQSLVIASRRVDLPPQLTLWRADFPAELTLQASTIARLEVSTGRRNRVRSAVLYSLAGAFIPVCVVFFEHTWMGTPYRQMTLSHDVIDKLGFYGLPTAGLVIGYGWPGERWHAAALPPGSPAP